jgi:hypothetical protein
MLFFLFQKEEIISENNIEQCQRENKVTSLNVLLLKIKSFLHYFIHSMLNKERKKKVSNIVIF